MNRMMVIAVDFDGTIVTHEYPEIGKEIPFAIETLKKLQNDFQCRLILWSVRQGDLLQEAVEFCRGRGLEFYAVNSNYPEATPTSGESRKINADLFIDDKNLGGLPDWGVIYQMIEADKALEPIPQPGREEYQPPQKKGFLKSLFG